MNAQFEIFPPERPHDRGGGGANGNFFQHLYVHYTLHSLRHQPIYPSKDLATGGGGDFPALLMLVSNRGGAAPPLNIFEGGLLSIHLITLTKFEGGKLSNRGGGYAPPQKIEGGHLPPLSSWLRQG